MATDILELHPGDDFIELFKVLKIQGWVGAGSEAKMLIADGHVLVNHEVETRKRRKLVPGDNVIFGEEAVLIQASDRAAPKVEPEPQVTKPKRRPSLKF
ncbi:RNA-binding S4 domain-containing protein [Ferrimonas balearica]|nr:RNA-binding S4 domain-containing protein [Ferrimonas balearica]